MTALAASAEVAVVGAGAMGTGIAQVAAQYGHRVHVFDTRMGAADAAKHEIAEALRKLAGKGRIDASEAEAAATRVVPVHALGDLVSAKLVVEAIVEDLDVKRKMFRDLEVVVAPEAVLASNTSSFSITSLAAGMKRPGRIVGMHFFNPAPILPLVEVVSGLATDRAVAELLYDTARAWGKVPVHVKSTPGFIVNRCARPFYGEALRLLLENAAGVATIDAVLREAGGFRMGPFELMDLIGLDVNFAVTKSVWEAYFHDPRYAPSTLQAELVAGGLLGRKTGRGFYDYGPNAPSPAPATEAPQAPPSRITAVGGGVLVDGLCERFASAGIAVERKPADGPAHFVVDGAVLASSGSGIVSQVVYDLARDYRSCTRLAVARRADCSDAAYAAAAGALQAAGIAVSRVVDVPGLVVMRTVAMLANEAADAVNQGIASASHVDLAMRNGVNYPAGPLSWADEIGLGRVRAVLAELASYYGDPRYRTSPRIALEEALTRE
jgi:3-hydroxybutyryl-CoA dehydrogenase